MRRQNLILFIFALVVFVLFWQRRRLDVSVTTANAHSSSQASVARAKKELPQHALDFHRAPQAKITESKAENSKTVSPEQAYCRLQAANAGILLEGQLKIASLAYDLDEENQSGFTAWIQSSECPPSSFSKIRMDNAGRIKEHLDCRTRSSASVAAQSGIQGDINEVDLLPNDLKLGISGPGFFVLECEGETYLNRSGDFQYLDGVLRYGGCYVLAQDGSRFAAQDEELDEKGCTRYGVCVALVLPGDPDSLEIVDRTTFRTKSDPFRFPVTNRHFALRSLEKLDDPRTGPMGPDWKRWPPFNVPDCSTIP